MGTDGARDSHLFPVADASALKIYRVAREHNLSEVSALKTLMRYCQLLLRYGESQPLGPGLGDDALIFKS